MKAASHVWSTEEQLLVKQVADQLSLALENARLFQETRQAQERLQLQNERLSAAAEIGRLVTSTLDLDTIFGRTVNLLSERFGYNHAAVFLVEEGGTTVVLREATGEAGAEMKARGHSLPINLKSIVGRVTSTGEAAVINDTAAEPDYKRNPLLPETRAECAIPLRVGNRIIGALDIHASVPGAFTRGRPERAADPGRSGGDRHRQRPLLPARAAGGAGDARARPGKDPVPGEHEP